MRGRNETEQIARRGRQCRRRRRSARARGLQCRLVSSHESLLYGTLLPSCHPHTLSLTSFAYIYISVLAGVVGVAPLAFTMSIRPYEQCSQKSRAGKKEERNVLLSRPSSLSLIALLGYIYTSLYWHWLHTPKTTAPIYRSLRLHNRDKEHTEKEGGEREARETAHGFCLLFPSPRCVLSSPPIDKHNTSSSVLGSLSA